MLTPTILVLWRQWNVPTSPGMPKSSSCYVRTSQSCHRYLCISSIVTTIKPEENKTRVRGFGKSSGHIVQEYTPEGERSLYTELENIYTGSSTWTLPPSFSPSRPISVLLLTMRKCRCSLEMVMYEIYKMTSWFLIWLSAVSIISVAKSLSRWHSTATIVQVEKYSGNRLQS